MLVINQMSSVGITENVKGDNKKFEVWFNGREEVYIIQVINSFSNTSYIKNAISFLMQHLCMMYIP